MGILSRFKEIMAANVQAMLDRAEDPEKTVDDFMRSLSRDLGQVKAETASVLAEERRTRRALDECWEEIAKLQRYAEKAVEAGNDAEARKFLERKGPLVEKQARLQDAYEAAAANASGMKQIQAKLERDIGGLEERRLQLKSRMAAAKAQQRLNAKGSPSGGGIDAAFKAAEEKVDATYYEAMAIAELRAESKDDLEEQLAQLDRKAETAEARHAGGNAGADAGTNTGTNTGASAEDELAALKEKLRKKE